MSPLERYHSDLKNKTGFSADPAQAEAVRHTHRLFLELVQADSPSNIPGPLLRPLKKRQKRQQGLYFWGGVGRGKSYLIDCFYHCLPFDEKWRVHFHRFMQYIHHELKKLEQTSNPLQVIASALTKRVRVLCLDELYVEDITDAMLLAGLLEALFANGVILVASANSAPEQLYHNGLQRARFIPAITLIKQHTQVFHFYSDIDYRLRSFDKLGLYYPLAGAHDQLMHDFSMLTITSFATTALTINGRTLYTVRYSKDVAWFRFSVLCSAPCGTVDYIELARCFQTILIEGVPVMHEEENDQARRFISLIDEFYDRGVKLIMSVAAVPEKLYEGVRLKKEFQRTISRLEEMRTPHYLARMHRP